MKSFNSQLKYPNPSYPFRLRDCIEQTEGLIREIQEILPEPDQNLHELTVDVIPRFTKEMIRNRVNGWFRSTRVLIETGSGKDDPNVRDFIDRGAAPIWGFEDYGTALIHKLELA